MDVTQLHAGPLAPFVAQIACAQGLARVRLIGELDLAAAPRAEAAIARAERREPPTLELDLSALAFMDSTGLRLMLGARERALDVGRRLVLRRGPFAVQRVFELTALSPLFEFVE